MKWTALWQRFGRSSEPDLRCAKFKHSQSKWIYRYGDTAIVTSAYRTRGTDGGKPFAHHGHFTDTWIKRNRKWVCVADYETLIN